MSIMALYNTVEHFVIYENNSSPHSICFAQLRTQFAESRRDQADPEQSSRAGTFCESRLLAGLYNMECHVGEGRQVRLRPADYKAISTEVSWTELTEEWRRCCLHIDLSASTAHLSVVLKRPCNTYPRTVP